MTWIEIMPAWEVVFHRLGWESAAPFLSWSGILVNRHRHREVEQVTVSEPESVAKSERKLLAKASGSNQSFFLKREHRVTWRDRLRNAWHGFGWCSTAVREGAMLQAIRSAGIGCPEVVALGENGRHAFLVMRDASEMTELRRMASALDSDKERAALASNLGVELAKMHDAGFEHLDLFAKHILAKREGDGYRFCILDWQRGRRRRSISWKSRCRDLAKLDATLHRDLASDRLRLRLLRAYLRATTACQSFGRLARHVRAHARFLAANRNLLEIGGLPTPPGDQQFVQLNEGRLLVVRSYYEAVNGCLPTWMTQLTKSNVPARDDCFSFSNASGASSEEMPMIAQTLFRLQLLGVPAPRLLAVAYSPTHVHAIVQPPDAKSLGEALTKLSRVRRCAVLRQAGELVRRLHEAGYHLPANESWTERLGITMNNEVVLAHIEPMPRSKAGWQESAAREFGNNRHQLSNMDCLRFLLGYLRRRRLLPEDRAWIHHLGSSATPRLERQGTG